MAKANPVKLKQEAEQFEKSGRLDQAIAKYRDIVAENPRDWNTVKKIGDLYVRLNRNREAIVEYEKLADFYAKDGFLLKAIAIWKQIQKLDSTALEPYLHLAELYAKQGLMMEAKSQYQIVVDEYLKRGKARDAGEVLKKMADIDPGDLKIRSRLADIYTRDGNAARAVEEHVAIAEELGKKGHLAEAIQVLEKGLKIDPRSARLRAELARVHLVQKSYDRAIHFLEEAVQLAPSDTAVLASLGEAYLGARKMEEAEAIFKRLLELNPQDDDSRVQMARLYLHQNEFDRAFDQLAPVVERALTSRDGERAVALLQQVAQRNPQHVPTLERLVEVYSQLKRDPLLAGAQSQLTEAYIAQGQYQQAAAVLEQLVERDPLNQQHRTKLEFVRSRQSPGAPARATPAPAPVVRPPSVPLSPPEEILEEEFDLMPADDGAAAPVFAPAVPSAAPAPSARVEVSGPLSDEDREFIEEHLAEGRVFRKYGLADKAVDQFEAVVARFPDNVDARLELRDLHREKGNHAKAAEHSSALAEICRLKGDVAGAQEHEQDALRTGGQPAPAPSAPAAPSVPAARPTASASEPAPAPAPDRGRGEEDEIPIEVEEAGFEPAPAAESGPAAGDDGTEFRLDDESGDELQVAFLDEDEAPAPVAAPEPAPPAAPPPFVPPPAVAPPPLAAPAPMAVPPTAPARAERPHSPAAAAPPPAPPASPSPASAELPVELRRVLDEVEQYVSLGFVDDAREALREVAGRYGTHPALLAKAAELGLELPGAEPAARPPATPARAAVPAPVASPEPEIETVEPEFAESDPFAELDLQVEPPAVDQGAEPEETLIELGDGPRPEESVVLDEVPSPPALFEEELELDLGVPGSEAPEPPEPVLDLDATEEEVEAAEPPEEVEVALEFGVPEVPEPPPLPFSAEPDELPFAAPGEGLELADELGELFGMQQAVESQPPEAATTFEDSGLADIFKEFKKGVDKQLGKEDYDTRYNLGIAYKEMGLLDEAIAEFQLAARDETRALECSSMLGICFMEKGMPKLAVKWFERGLGVAGRREEEYQGLRYDLASAFAAAGEQERALSIFTELYGQNANFRDVAVKVRELGAGR